MDDLRWAAEAEVLGDARASVLEGAIAALPLPVILYARDGNWLAANQRYVGMFGRVPASNILTDEVGRPFGVNDGFRRALGGEVVEVPGFWYDPVLRSPDEPRAGRRMFLGLTLVPVRDGAGAVEHVVLIMRDDTDDQLARQEAARVRDQLRADLAHEAAVAGELRSSESAKSMAQRMTRIGSFEVHLDDNGVEADVRWSDEVYRIFGHRPGGVDLSAAVFFDAVHPDDRARVRTAMNKTLDTGQRFELDHRIVLPDGGERMVCAQAILEHGASGRPIRVVGTVQDVTEQRLAEAVLRESEERLQMALATGRMLAWEVDLATGQLFLSRNAGEVLGLRPGQHLGTVAEIAALIAPADRAAVEAIMADAIRGQPRSELEVRLTRPIDGGVVTILSRSHPTLPSAPIRRMRGLAIDITEQKRLDDALRASEQRYRTLVELAPEAITVVDMDTGRYVEVNGSAALLFETTRDQLLQSGPAELSPLLQPDGRRSDEAAIAYIAQAFAGETPIFEWVHRSLRGRDIHCEIRLCRMPGDQRRLIRGSVVDITERKRVEEMRARSVELEIQNRRIREASRLKSEFLANMSHELRTPLNAIIGFAELLHDGQVPVASPQFREFLGDILTSGRHLLQLINDVLDLSKIEAGKTEFRAEGIDLGRLIGEVVAILRTAAARKRLAVSVAVEPGLDDLRLDPARLKQVLYNYLSNAIKFTGDGGRVTVAARGDGPERIRLEVVDTGPGIATADLGKLFVEFQQLDAAHRQAGTGLGLAVTRRLVEAQGGAVGVLSTPGQGSTFYAVLPRCFGGEVVRRTRTITATPVGVARVLVVEDDMVDQRVLADGLSAAGYHVIVAATAAEALERSRAEHVDAVTVDLLLPDASGLELIRDLRASAAGRDLPIVVVTVVGDASAVAGFAVAAVLTKPATGEQVAAALLAAGVPPLSLAAGDSRPVRGGPMSVSLDSGPAAPTVLLVEDNAATRKLVRFVLEKEGYAVIEAPTGCRALELMASERPALVLQDLLLPDMDGIELARRLRGGPGGDTRILAFSGFVSHLDDVRISGAGFDDIVTKPIEPTRLLQVVSAHLPVRPAATDLFGAGKRVLVVDDEPVMLTLTRTHLARHGFTVIAARDVDSALAEVGVAVPDVVVSDVLMPGRDGYELVATLRASPALAAVPVVLVTSSLVETADRELAVRAGASGLVVRTPDARELLTALRAVLLGPPPPPVSALPPATELERERVSRMVRQLESHAMVNARLVQRSSSLAAELRVMTGISEAVVRRRDVEVTLDEALEACFDAGGISVGALYRLGPDGGLGVRIVGGDPALAAELTTFFGHESVLRGLIAELRSVGLPSATVPDGVAQVVLGRCGATSALVVPLVHGETGMGALFMASSHRDLRDDDWRSFAEGVGHQITLALALAGAFAEIEASRSRWKALVEHAPDLVLQIAPGGRIVFVNRTTPPRRPEDAVGQLWTKFTAPEYHEPLQSALASVIATGMPASLETLSIDGRWYSMLIGPLIIGGEITGAIATARDITARKQTEAQLIVSDRMASVGTLAAGVAHEINNPLAAVLANLELAQRAIARLSQYTMVGELGELIHEARDAADRVRHIVRDLRVFSRAEEEQHGPVDVRAVLDSTLRITWNEIRHRARLVRDFHDVPPVLGNESRLGQVFVNLLVNAAHAIPEGQAEANQITVRTRVRDDRIAVEVIDTGSGMAPAVMHRLFTPFFTTKPVGVGTGLGLSICQRIVTAMGGEIRVDSTPGQGSTFSVLLPAAPSPRSAPPAEPSVRLRQGRRGRVLVIDDEALIALAIRRMLSDDHDVQTVGRAEDALVKLRAGEQYDVILCDLMMPQVTGMDLHATLSREKPDLVGRMIFMTGGAFTLRARQFLDGVPNPRIEKPFDAQLLRALVDGIVG